MVYRNFTGRPLWIWDDLGRERSVLRALTPYHADAEDVGLVRAESLDKEDGVVRLAYPYHQRVRLMKESQSHIELPGYKPGTRYIVALSDFLKARDAGRQISDLVVPGRLAEGHPSHLFWTRLVQIV